MGLPLKNWVLPLKNMGLPLKNCVKIKASSPKNSIFFYSNPKGVLNFYNLPLENSMVPQPGGGGEGGRILNALVQYLSEVCRARKFADR